MRLSNLVLYPWLVLRAAVRYLIRDVRGERR